MIRVTDQQYWIHPTLKRNIDTLIINAQNDFDFMIIVSGSGNVRTGKSVFAQQLGYYMAKHLGTPFTLQNNIIFGGQELIKNALNSKPNSVFVYDEAREGLDSKRMWSEMTMTLLDFFSECGMLNHILIIVLPDYFELPKSIAVTRSIALINVYYTPKIRKTRRAFGDIPKGQEYLEFNRGKFDYYNRKSKKRLWVYGKKTQDYEKGKPVFSGEFRNHWVIEPKEYNKKKKEFLRRSRIQSGFLADKYLDQRNVALKSLSQSGVNGVEIADLLTKNGWKCTKSYVNKILKGTRGRLYNNKPTDSGNDSGQKVGEV